MHTHIHTLYQVHWYARYAEFRLCADITATGKTAESEFYVHKWHLHICTTQTE